MNQKRTTLYYVLECPGYWWSCRERAWVAHENNVKGAFRNNKFFRTKAKALSALTGLRYIKDAFVQQVEHTKKGSYLLRRWVNK